jgi:tRNA dimethylallyltransferase
MGPTASGKTALAVELVQRFPFEIISVDSAMIYKEMDIGTAKPDAETQAIAPHALIDFLDPAESYSAARFVQDAEREIARIEAAGRWPLLVGGTGLYFRALGEGLARMPDADEEVRARLVAWREAEGLEALHRYLATVDPRAAQRIHPNDPQRILRALEVYELTGEPISQHHEQAAATSRRPMLKLIVAPEDRAILHERIAQRFRQMMAMEFLAEVERLYRRGDLHAGMPSMRAVGYRQLWQYLADEVSLDEAVERGIIATRQYAKRQFTWLRKEQEAYWLGGDADKVSKNAISELRRAEFLQ